MREGHAAYCTKVASPTIFALAPTGNPQQLHPRRNAIPRAPCFLMPPQERDHPRPSRAAVQTRIRRDLLPGIFVKEITPNFSFARDDADSSHCLCPTRAASKVFLRERNNACCLSVCEQRNAALTRKHPTVEESGVWGLVGLYRFLRQDSQGFFADRVEPCYYPAFRGTEEYRISINRQLAAISLVGFLVQGFPACRSRL